MNRRSFILVSAVGISALGAGFSQLLRGGFKKHNLYARPHLLSKLCDDDTLQFIGRAYMESAAGASDRDQLMLGIYGRQIHTDSLKKEDILLMQAQVDNSIRVDFENGRTLVLRGWVLSLTEARQCALYTILNS